MKTRAQEDSQLAYKQISELPEATKKAYGGLCHHFPMMVLRSGLCQAVAFYTVKAKGQTNATAYKEFLEHMATASGNKGMAYDRFQEHIHQLDLDRYRQTTRRILAAAIWYKRFAISLLDVDGSGDNNE